MYNLRMASFLVTAEREDARKRMLLSWECFAGANQEKKRCYLTGKRNKTLGVGVQQSSINSYPGDQKYLFRVVINLLDSNGAVVFFDLLLFTSGLEMP